MKNKKEIKNKHFHNFTNALSKAFSEWHVTQDLFGKKKEVTIYGSTCGCGYVDLNIKIKD